MKRAVSIVLALAWLVSMAWLIRYEAYPSYFTKTLSGYRTLLSGDVLVVDSWYEVRFNDTPIGYSHTWVDVRESNPTEHYVVENLTELRLGVLGTRQHLLFDSEAFLDIGHRLQRFRFSVRTDGYVTNVEGKRAQGTRFLVEMRTGHSESKYAVEIPDDTVIYSPVVDVALSRLAPGDSLTMKTFNPLLGESIPVRIEAITRDLLDLDGEEIPTTELAIHNSGMTMRAWIDEDGQLVRQDTELGWTILRSTREQATAAVLDTGDMPDILRALAVQCTGAIEDPRNCVRVKLRLRGVPFELEELETHRQTAYAEGENTYVLESIADQPGDGDTHRTDPGSLAPKLAATDYIHSADPDIRKRAERITEDCETDLQKAYALARWVDTSVRNEPRVSLPSAVDVLKRLEGDCNEHTYLYVALARSIGLPAKVVVGIVYHEGSFYYHAWPAVHVGRWLELDPTLEQLEVDAAHIALLEGELRDQMALTKVFGRLTIDVLEQTHNEERAVGPDA